MARDAGADPTGREDLTAGAVGPKLMMLVRSFVASRESKALFLFIAGIVVVIGLTAYGQVRLNAWNEPFYDALARKDFRVFLIQLGVFAIIASCLLVLNVAQGLFVRMMQVKLREGLTRDLINEWMKPNRAFRLQGEGRIGINPDQRIHEDAQHLTELSTSLGVGLFQSTLLLLSFIGVLWVLSQGVVFNIQGYSFTIPGYMVWAALFYAGIGSFFSWRVGRPLVALNAERYAREADLRFALVRVSEHAEGVALNAGEADEARRLHQSFDQVLDYMRRIVRATVRLTWVTSGYGWFTLVAPIIVAAPGYFTGELSFGGLMVAVGAFNQVQQALRWFIDNVSAIADWQATLLRVANFRLALTRMDDLGRGGSRIERTIVPSGPITIHNLEVYSPTGVVRLREKSVEIKPGEHVLIVGESGAGKSILFRAMAGLWPLGSGSIGLSGTVMFMPRQPYVPPGTLRAGLAYPEPPSKFTDADLVAALKAVRLGHLAGDLDRKSRWDKELSTNDQELIGFARVVLAKPDWLLIDEALDVLDDEQYERITTLFNAGPLRETGVVNVGRIGTRDHFFTRTLHIEREVPKKPATVKPAKVASAA